MLAATSILSTIIQFPYIVRVYRASLKQQITVSYVGVWCPYNFNIHLVSLEQITNSRRNIETKLLSHVWNYLIVLTPQTLLENVTSNVLCYTYVGHSESNAKLKINVP